MKTRTQTIATLIALALLLTATTAMAGSIQVRLGGVCVGYQGRSGRVSYLVAVGRRYPYYRAEHYYATHGVSCRCLSCRSSYRSIRTRRYNSYGHRYNSNRSYRSRYTPRARGTYYRSGSRYRCR